MNALATFPKPAQRGRARYSIAEYYAICDALADFGMARTELIGGEIYYMSPQHTGHARLKTEIAIALNEAIKRRKLHLEMLVEVTTEIGVRDAPLPDVLVFDAPDARKGVPAESVKLAIEIADSSEKFDLGKKKRLYAAAMIPEYWVAVLRTGKLERFWVPDGKDYAQHDSLDLDGDLASVTLPELAIAKGSLRR
jgi:Uma2 family endonuclease